MLLLGVKTRHPFMKNTNFKQFLSIQSNLALIIFFILIYLSLTTMAASEDRKNKKQWQKNCEAWATFHTDKLKLVNNTWGKIKGHNYPAKQCIYQNLQDKNKFAWSWYWDADRYGVKAYPSLVFGKKPWHDKSTDKKLPLQLKQLYHADVEFKVRSQHEGRVNLLLEAWLTNSKEANPQDRTSEIAIHLYQQNWPGQGGDYYSTIRIGQHKFNVYVNHKMKVPNDSHTWSYISFVNTGKPITADKINLSDFLNYALKEKMIIASEYLSSIELGNEIDQGKGITYVDEFYVDIKDY